MPGDITLVAGGRVGLSVLHFLIESKFPIKCVLMNKATDVNIAQTCEDQSIPAMVLDPDLYDLIPGSTWLVAAWSTHIFPRDFLSKFAFRVNLHPGLLPHSRGSDSSTWAIIHGYPTGVSLIEIRHGVDTGEIWVQREVPVPRFTKARHLHRMLEDALINLFEEDFPAIYGGYLKPVPQIGEGLTFRRIDTLKHRTQRIEDFKNVMEFISWTLAHDYSPIENARLVVDGHTYSITMDFRELS